MHYRGSQTKKKFYKNLKLVFAQSDDDAIKTNVRNQKMGQAQRPIHCRNSARLQKKIL